MNGVNIVAVYVTKFSENDPYIPFGYKVNVSDSTTRLTGLTSGDYDAYTLSIWNLQYNLGLNFVLITRELTTGVLNYLDIIAGVGAGQTMPFVEHCLLNGQVNNIIVQEYNQSAANTFQNIGQAINTYVSNPTIGKFNIPLGYYDTLYAHYNLPTQKQINQVVSQAQPTSVTTVNNQVQGNVSVDETPAEGVSKIADTDTSVTQPSVNVEQQVETKTTETKEEPADVGIPDATIFGEDNTDKQDDGTDTVKVSIENTENVEENSNNVGNNSTSNDNISNENSASQTDISTGNLRELFPYLYEAFESRKLNTNNLEYFLSKLISKYHIEFTEAGSDVFESISMSQAEFAYNLRLLSDRYAKVGCYGYDIGMQNVITVKNDDGSTSTEAAPSTIYAYKDETNNIDINNLDSRKQAVYNVIVERLVHNSDMESTVAMFNWLCSLEITNKSLMLAFLHDILNHPLKVHTNGSALFASDIPYITALQALKCVIVDADNFRLLSCYKSRFNLYDASLTEKINAVILGTSEDEEMIKRMDEALVDYFKYVERESVRLGYLVSVLGPISETPFTFEDDSENSSDEQSDCTTTPLYIEENNALVNYLMDNVVYPVADSKHQTILGTLSEMIVSAGRNSYEDVPSILYGVKMSELIGLPTMRIVFAGNYISFTCVLNGGTTGEITVLDPVVLARQIYKATMTSIYRDDTEQNTPIVNMMYDIITSSEVLGDSDETKICEECWERNINTGNDLLGTLPITDQNIYGIQDWRLCCAPVGSLAWRSMGITFFRFITQPALVKEILRQQPSLKASNNLDNYITLKDMKNIINNVDNTEIRTAVTQVKDGLEDFFDYMREVFLSSDYREQLSYNTCLAEIINESKYEDNGVSEIKVTASMIFYEQYQQDIMNRTGRDPYTLIDLFNGSTEYTLLAPVLANNLSGKNSRDIRLIGAIVRSEKGEPKFMPIASKKFIDYLISNNSVIKLGEKVKSFIDSVKSGVVAPDASKWPDTAQFQMQRKLCSVKGDPHIILMKLFGQYFLPQQVAQVNDMMKINQKDKAGKLYNRFINVNYSMLLNCPLFRKDGQSNIENLSVFDHDGDGNCMMKKEFSNVLVGIFNFMYAWTGDPSCRPIVLNMLMKGKDDPNKTFVMEIAEGFGGSKTSTKSLTVLSRYTNTILNNMNRNLYPAHVEKWINEKFEDDINASYEAFL